MPTIEQNLERIANAVEALVKNKLEYMSPPATPPTPTDAPQMPANLATGPDTTPQMPANLTIGPDTTPQMPTFDMTSQAETPSPTHGITVNNLQEFIKYIMQAYNELGQAKGRGISTIMTNLGYDNVNNVKPEHFQEFINQVEALKVAP